MAFNLDWKMGFEVELVAPRGQSRRDLAKKIATNCDGTAVPFFHPQSEPSDAPGRPTFENLTLAFKVCDQAGSPIASFVDDLTLQADMDKRKPPLAGWYRIIADDARILRLVMRHCDAAMPHTQLLDPLADLFGTQPQTHEGGLVRVVDDRKISVAIAAPLPGERERPCEIVTAPIEVNHEEALTALLDQAGAMGFYVPVEGATHIHFDASALCSAPVIARLVAVFERFGDSLKKSVGVNPNCVRLGAWPDRLRELTGSTEFQAMDWPKTQESLAKLSLSKYCDFNLLNIAHNNAEKHTFEVRILPATLDANFILEAAELFQGILKWCCDLTSGARSLPESFNALIDQLPFAEQSRAQWKERASRNEFLG
ncbi:MAG: amidoligase family protein [Pontixanthobacter sp.]